MHVQSSVRDAFETCLTNKSFTLVHLKEQFPTEPLVSSDFYCIIYIRSGKLRLLLHNHLYECFAKNILIIRPFECLFIHPDHTKAEALLLIVHKEYLQTLDRDRNTFIAAFGNIRTDFHHMRKLNLQECEHVKTLFHRMSAPTGFDVSLCTHHACRELLLRMVTLFSHKSKPPEEIRYNPVEEILDFLNESFTEDYSLQELSSHFYMSVSTLCHRFREETGTTLITYLNLRRISLAKVLLSDSRDIKRCLLQCGYRDYSTFRKAFKKYVGCSPKAFAIHGDIPSYSNRKK